MNGPTCFRAAFQGLRASRGGPLRQRPAVRIVGRGWAFATVDMVAEAGRGAAFRPSGFAAGQWSTRADAPHAGGADDATTGALRERTAAALRCVSPALQRGASARGAGAEAAGANLAPLLAADARADQRPLVRRPSRGPTRRARPGQSHCAFQPSRPRHDRSEKKCPPFRPAAHAAGRNGGNKGRIVSTIIPVQNVKYHSGCTPRAPHPTLYEVFFVKRKICVVSGPGRRVGGPLEARSCPSKPWRRKMSLARRLSRPKPPEAVAEGVPGMGAGLEVKVRRGARW